MNTSCWLAGKDTGWLADIVGAGFTPWDAGRVFLVENVDIVSIDLDTTINFLDCPLEATWKLLYKWFSYHERSRSWEGKLDNRCP